jgi:hypothetical protein
VIVKLERDLQELKKEFDFNEEKYTKLYQKYYEDRRQ